MKKKTETGVVKSKKTPTNTKKETIVTTAEEKYISGMDSTEVPVEIVPKTKKSKTRHNAKKVKVVDLSKVSDGEMKDVANLEESHPAVVDVIDVQIAETTDVVLLPEKKPSLLKRFFSLFKRNK